MDRSPLDLFSSHLSNLVFIYILSDFLKRIYTLNYYRDWSDILFLSLLFAHLVASCLHLMVQCLFASQPKNMVLYCIFIMKFAKYYIFDFLRVVWINNDGSGENNMPHVVKKNRQEFSQHTMRLMLDQGNLWFYGTLFSWTHIWIYS